MNSLRTVVETLRSLLRQRGRLYKIHPSTHFGSGVGYLDIGECKTGCLSEWFVKIEEDRGMVRLTTRSYVFDVADTALESAADYLANMDSENGPSDYGLTAEYRTNRSV
jgi:hypothetical protein